MVHRLIVNNELVLYGDVGDMWGDGSGFAARDVIDALAEMSGDLTVRLNSGGGFVWEGNAIFSALKAHAGEVTIYVDAIAASAASVIAMAGDLIVMREGALMMIHDPSGLTIGTAADHRGTANVLDKLGDIAAGIYARRSGKGAEEIRELMLAETWLSAEEAVEMGFADEVEDGVKAVAATPFDYTLYSNAPDAIRQNAMRERPREARNTEQVDNHAEHSLSAPLIAQQTAVPDAQVIAEAIMALASNVEQEIVPASTVADTATQTEEGIMPDNKPAVAAETQATNETETKLVEEAPVASTRDMTKEIFSLCRAARLSMEQAEEIVQKAENVDKAKDMIIEMMASRDPDPTTTPHIAVTADARDKFKEGATRALLHRAGMEGGEVNEFTSMKVSELAREHLKNQGANMNFRDPIVMAGEALRPSMAAGQHSTSDFVEILANVANKAMLKGYMEAEETFEAWTARGVLTDFRAEKRVDLNLFPSLTEVPEGAEYTHGTMGDRGETIQLATYGKMFAITRQAIVNDDLNAFTRIPSRMGRAARRTIGNLVYAVLTDNAAMSDSIALFHSDHSNLAGSGGAPTVTTVDAGRSAMALQKDPDSHATALNIRPRYMLVPVELEGVSQTLMAAEFDPSKTQRSPNHVRGLATVISDGRLSSNSAAAWYLAADPNQHDTIEVAYLNGNSQPMLEQRDGWNVDGVEFKVRIDAGVKALDFRGLYKNAGQ